MLFSKKILLSFFLIFLGGIFYFFITNCKYKPNNTLRLQVELGKYLFFDRRLSINYTRACGTCHNPQMAFTDGYKRSLGAYADLHKRNTQPLFNLSYHKFLTAADSSIHTLMEQMNNPLYNTHPIEMGVNGHEQQILNRILKDSLYKILFKKVNYPIDWLHIKLAISKFESSLISLNSPYDKYLAGDSNALSYSQKNGLKLFFSNKLNCSTCHGGKNFSAPTINENYFNIGIYNNNNSEHYPNDDKGLFELTKSPKDIGKFRVPTLRNLLFTAPYYHDGSENNLKAIINNYAAGGRKIEVGNNKGNGALNLNKHYLITGFDITESDKFDLIAFLHSLSDSSMFINPSFQNPFKGDETKK